MFWLFYTTAHLLSLSFFNWFLLVLLKVYVLDTRNVFYNYYKQDNKLYIPMMRIILIFLDFCVQVNSHNKTIETQHFCKDENQDHSNEEAWLLGSSTDSSISNDSNCKPCC